MHPTPSTFSHLPDAELLVEVKRLAAQERQATTALNASLCEVDARKLYLREGYSSLFTYCTTALRLSEAEAYFRIKAARAAAQWPLVLERLAEGEVTLTAITLLAPHLTDENCRQVLDAARGASKTDVEELVARLRPRPDAPTVVRKLPSPRREVAEVAVLASPGESARGAAEVAATEATSRSAHVGVPGLFVDPIDAFPTTDAASEPAVIAVRGHSTDQQACQGIPDAAALRWLRVAGSPMAAELAATAAAPKKRSAVTALAPERYKVQMTVGAETRDKLRKVQDLLRRSVPDGDVAAIFDRALTLLLEHL